MISRWSSWTAIAERPSQDGRLLERAETSRWPSTKGGSGCLWCSGSQRSLPPCRWPMAAAAETCGDSDDVFLDEKRNRIYVSCGEGFVDVFEVTDAGFRRTDHIATVPGARTSLFVPALDRLFLAVRASQGEPAAIWVYAPGL